MLFTAEERNYFDKICSSTTLTKSQVKQVLLAQLHVLTRQTYNRQNEIIIPFIAKLKFSYDDEVTTDGLVADIKIEAEPCNAFKREVSFIAEGEKTPTERYINNLFDNCFKELLEMDVEEKA